MVWFMLGGRRMLTSETVAALAVSTALLSLGLASGGCGSSRGDVGDAAPADGAAGTGGTAMGGAAGTGGATGTGGAAATGGVAGTGGAAGTGGVAGSGGAAGTGGRGTGGTGTGGALSACPVAAPFAGSACAGLEGAQCFYEDCAGVGRTTATCTGGRWQEHNTACTQVPCQFGASCPAGTICVQYVGGAVTTMCVANPCGTGPVSCACLTCSQTCQSSWSETAGIRTTCNTCTDPRGCA